MHRAKVCENLRKETSTGECDEIQERNTQKKESQI